MARPPKNKGVEGAVPIAMASKASEGSKQIDVENFIKVRNSVYERIATVSDLIKTIAEDYMRQTNLLLGEGTLDNGAMEMPMPQLGNAFAGLMPQVPVLMPPMVEEKKERKKRTHDPNAPKRPLTPYFLYMQTARPIIAQDLGVEAPKGAVQEEGQRRWSTMSPSDKAGWDQAYQYNLRLYNARVHSYKAGNANAKMMSDDEALKYADEYQIPMPDGKNADVGNDHDAIAEQLQQAPVEEEAPAKTPKSTKKEGGGRKRKSDAIAAPVPVAAVPVPVAVPASPDKKRKRASKAFTASSDPNIDPALFQ